MLCTGFAIICHFDREVIFHFCVMDKVCGESLILGMLQQKLHKCALAGVRARVYNYRSL